MRATSAVLTALTALSAYYVYSPLPSTVSEPWKLMLLDATFRCAQDLSNLAHYFGFSHHLRVLNFVSSYFDKLDPVSSEHLKVTDTVFDGVEVRIFEPKRGFDKNLKKAIVYIHGGGWALGSARMRSYDSLCRKISEDVNAVVVSIEYRLVPDVHFPEQLNDALAATKYFLLPEVLAEYSIDPLRIAVSGDSAGGNLAAAVCQQLALDSSVTTKVKLQALIYPVLQVLDFNTPSYQQNMDMPILSRFVMIKFWLDYLNGSHSFAHSMLVNNHTSLDLSETISLRELLNWNSLLPPSFKKNYKPVLQSQGTDKIISEVPALLDLRASPLIAKKESLQLLPKTYILTCEHDVLRDDGTMYAKRLEEAGVDVTHDHYEDGFHGCMLFATWPTYFSVGARTRDGYVKWLNENL
ncbi:neutral cholesterol ester hydrolase 1 S homeolog precursor [Xenopus laevis]|uniref:Neutral cholesterol ester hydrolase 1 n=1 Tax=Xenopus laevis TaxID=8355 RepID=A5PKQ7_XENLA|nr:neutral cholesterol ester hydrolase 1 S homeolog precursor [Xenopus laevis]AAI42578.1 LOC100101305 protein [Xenopus laevis]